MPKSKRPTAKLFDCPNPLQEKLDGEFLAAHPKSPGIYFCENAEGRVLYIGKTSNLAHKIKSFVGARPLDSSLRTKKILYSTERMRWESCASGADAQHKEKAALKQSSPVLNRRLVSAPKYPFLSLEYKAHNKQLTLKLLKEMPAEADESMNIHGPIRAAGGLSRIYPSLLRVLWFTAEADKKNGDFINAPGYLFRQHPPRQFRVRCEPMHRSQLQAYLSGIRGINLVLDLSEKLLARVEPGSFHHKVLSRDFQKLVIFYERVLSYDHRLQRFHKLGKQSVPKDRIDDLQAPSHLKSATR